MGQPTYKFCINFIEWLVFSKQRARIVIKTNIDSVSRSTSVMIHLASLAQPAISWKIEAHLWFCLWGHFQREITQGKNSFLMFVSASHRLGDWTGQKERSSWHSFLSASWLLWHELPGLSWIEVTETRSPSEPTPFKLFLSGVIAVMRCDPSLPMITEVGSLSWGAEITYYLDHPVSFRAFIQRPGIWKGQGTWWPILCSALAPVGHQRRMLQQTKNESSYTIIRLGQSGNPGM